MANFEHNTALAKKLEADVQENGFTLLVYPIRKFLNENLNNDPLLFAVTLGKIIEVLSYDREGEKDGGYGARKFLKDEFDLDI